MSRPALFNEGVKIAQWMQYHHLDPAQYTLLFHADTREARGRLEHTLAQENRDYLARVGDAIMPAPGLRIGPFKTGIVTLRQQWVVSD